jgi:hypothetical protein
MPEGGMPDANPGSTKYAFAYHKPNIGLAVGINMRSAIDWIPDRTSWLINTIYMAGAVAIPQADGTQLGIVKIEHNV